MLSSIASVAVGPPTAAPAANALSRVLRDTAEARGLPNAAYVDRDWFDVERRQLLARSWLAIAFAADVAPGEAAPVDVAGWPLLLVRERGEDGALRVFHNVCRHRGHRLVLERGPFRGHLRCPYHGWCYAANGRLEMTPHAGGIGVHKAPGMDRSTLGLVEVRSRIWLGVVLVDLSGEAPALEQHVEPLEARWERFLGSPRALHRLSPMRLGSELGFRLRCNWKLAVENYCEAYHLPWVHPGLNNYSPLARHYNIVEPGWGAGQGSTAFMLSEFDGRRFPTFEDWPIELAQHAEYVALFPNLLLGLQRDHVFAMLVLPVDEGTTLERVGLFGLGTETEDPAWQGARDALLESWRTVFAEDVSAVENMQIGRHSPGYDGGAFSAVMDPPTHEFHRWVASAMLGTARNAGSAGIDRSAAAGGAAAASAGAVEVRGAPA